MKLMLTEKQIRVLRYFRDFRREKGIAPTLDEAASALGVSKITIHEHLKQLSRKGVTRKLLWSEYRDQHEDGIGYSVFCDELSAYSADRDLSYRNDHVPGEKGYFDFAGTTLRYRDDAVERNAQIFVAALGYSNAIFAQAYGAAEARRFLHYWRTFFLSCAELWGYRAGAEWLVSHYLFARR